jgi:hypothetical protein
MARWQGGRTASRARQGYARLVEWKAKAGAAEAKQVRRVSDLGEARPGEAGPLSSMDVVR